VLPINYVSGVAQHYMPIVFIILSYRKSGLLNASKTEISNEVISFFALLLATSIVALFLVNMSHRFGCYLSVAVYSTPC
jgi:hypothetical protein